MLKCDTCGLVKSESEFTINYRSKIDPNKVSYKKTCKSCRAKKQNVWSHNEGKESILNYRINNKEQHNEIQRRKIRERKKLLVEMLGGKCESCGTTKNLQFDHIDPTTKSFSIAKKYMSPVVFEEIKKCQLLCYECHLKKTSEEWQVCRGVDKG